VMAAENECEIAPVKATFVIEKTRTTKTATNTGIAPYSVIPCPLSSVMNLKNEAAEYMAD